MLKRLIVTGLALVFLLGALGPMVAGPAAAANQGDIGTNWIYSDTLTAGDPTDNWNIWESVGDFVAVMTYPATNYDLRIYSGVDGGGAGLTTSSVAGAAPELCIWNGHGAAGANHVSAQVFNSGAGVYGNSYDIEYDMSTTLSINSPYGSSFAWWNMLAVYDVYLTAGVTYTFRFTTIGNGNADYRFNVFRPNAGAWTNLAASLGNGGYNPGSGYWSCQITPAASAWYGVAMMNYNGVNTNYQFVVGAPDLVINSVSITPNPVTISGITVIPQNRPYSLVATVYNQGYGDAGAFTVTSYFDWNAWASSFIGGLNARSSTSTSMSYNTAAPDTHNLYALADSGGAVAEDNAGGTAENNNIGGYRYDCVAEARAAYTNDNDDTVPSALGFSYYFYTYYYFAGDAQEFALWNPSANTDFDMYLYSPTGGLLATSASASYPERFSYTSAIGGYYYIYVIRASGAGNGFTFSVDSADPTLQVVQPLDGAYIKGNYELRLNCQDQGSGITDTASNPRYRVDGGAWTDMGYSLQAGYNYVASLNTALLTDGGHSLDFAVTDNAGNSAGAKASIVVDNTQPSSCSLVHPTANQYVEGDLTIKVSASDAVAMDSVSLAFGGVLAGLGGQAAVLDGTTGYWQYELDTKGYNDGSASVAPTARDKAQNTLSQAATFFVVDNLPPTLSLTAPANNSWLAGSAVSINATASDAAGTVTVRYKVDGGSWTTMSLSGGQYTATWDTKGVIDGRHIITVRATDGIGHITEQSVSVTADNTDPTCYIVAPSAGQYMEGKFVFKVYAYDANGIGSVRMTIGGVGVYSLSYSSFDDLYELELDTTLLPDATYSLSVNVSDNSVAQGLRGPVMLSLGDPSFFIDNIAPTLDLVSPADNDYVEGTVALSVTSFDAPVEPTLYYSVDGLSPVAMTAGAANSWTANWNSLGVTDGKHILRFRAVGHLGHETAIVITVTVDNTAPVCSVAAPLPGLHVEGTHVLKVAASDTVGIANLSVRLVNATRVFSMVVYPSYNPVSDYYEYSLVTTMLEDGVYSINATALDAIGHITASMDVEFTIDNHPPQLAVLRPAPDQYVRGEVALQLDAQDEFLARTSYSVDGSPFTELVGGAGTWNCTGLPDGRHTLLFCADDIIGHSTTVSFTVTVDNHSPAAFWGAPDERSFLSGVYLVRIKATDQVGVGSVVLTAGGKDYPMTLDTGNGHYEYPLDTSALPDGDTQLTVTVKELSGLNPDTVTVRTVRIDNSYPTLSVISPVQGEVVNGSYELDLTAYDAYLDKAEYRVDSLGWSPANASWDTSRHPDGPHTLTFRAVDRMGRVTEVALGLTIDNSLPSCAFIAPNNDTFVSGVTLLQVRAVDEAALAQVVLVGAGAEPLYFNPVSGLYEARLDTTALADGTYQFRVDCTDLSGHAAYSAIWLKVDNNAPELSVQWPEDMAYLTGILALQAVAPDAFDTVLEYQLDNLGWKSANRTIDTSLFADGPHALSVRATDESGKSALVQLTIYLDNSPPLVSVLSPSADNVAMSGEFDLRVAVNEGEQLKGITYALDDGPTLPLLMNRANGYYELVIHSTALSEGQHTITIKAVNQAGLVTNITRTFKVDNTPPVVTVRSPKAADQQGVVVIALDVADATGIASVQVRIDGGQWKDMMVSRTPGRYEYKWSTGVSQNGEHRFEVRTEDTLGNHATSAYTFKVRNPDYNWLVALVLVLLIVVGVLVVLIRGRSRKKAEKMAPPEEAPAAEEKAPEGPPAQTPSVEPRPVPPATGPEGPAPPPQPPMFDRTVESGAAMPDQRGQPAAGRPTSSLNDLIDSLDK